MRKAVRIFLALLLLCTLLSSCAGADEIANGVGDALSDISDLQALEVPSKVWIEGGYLYWNPVEYATGYTVSVDGRESVCEDTKFSLENVPDGDHTFTVKANGDGEAYESSTATEALSVRLTAGAVTQTGNWSSFENLDESYLGYGFDVIRSAVFSDKYVKLSSPIFKTEELHNQRLLKVDSKYSYVDEILSNSIEEFSTKWNAGANVNVSWGGKRLGGSVELSAKYSNTNKQTKSVAYQCVSITNQQFYLVMQGDLATYRNMMTDAFKADLYSDMSPAAFFDRYGTHFITSAVMGGKINSYYLHSSETEQSLSSASAKAAVEVRAWKTKVNVDASVSWREEMSNMGIDVTNTLEVIGGGDFGMLNAQDVPANYENWEKSLDTDASLIGIKDSGSLWAVWELIDPALDTAIYTWEDENGVTQQGSRSEQLQAYFFQYGVESYNDLMEAAGLPEIIVPESIENIRVNGNEAQSGEYIVYAGVANDVTFTVLPQNAVGYVKSVSLSTACTWASINEQNQLVIEANAPANALLTVVVSAGGVRSQIQVRVRQTYTVEYNTRYPGVTVEKNVGVLYGDTLLEPVLPARPGFVLVGWFSDAACTNKWDFLNDYVQENMMLFAKWAEYNPTITFRDSINSNVMDPVKVAYDTALAQPSNPVLPGYTFGGFYSDPDTVRSFDFSQKITEDTVIWLKWLPDIKVQFISNVSEFSKNTEKVPYNTALEEPIAPMLSGYTFGGWFADSRYEQAFDFEQALTKDAKVYVLWHRNPTVTFYSNAEGYTKAPVTVPYNTALARPATPILSGYTFENFYGDHEFKNVFDFSKPIIEDTVIYVKWNTNPTVHFFSSVAGFSMEAVKVPYGGTLSEPVAPVLTHYTFGGWFADVTMQTPFDFGQLITSDTTVYAKLTPKNYTITYQSNGGDAVPAESVPYGARLPEPPEIYKANCWFVGWYYDAALQNKVDFANDTVQGDRTLYAAWTDKKTYTVSFEVNGGEPLNDVYVQEGSGELTVLPVPVRTGYTFAGWYSTEGFAQGTEVTDCVFTQNTVLYAKWSKNTYQISYECGESALSGSYTTGYSVTQEIVIPTPVPTRIGYAFVGWYEDDALSVPFVNDLLKNPRNVTLYAKLEPVAYTITYVGGTYQLSGDYTREYTVNSGAIALPTVVHATYPTHYTFKGWFTDAALSKAFVNDLLENPRNVTLYPKLEATVYTVTYHLNGGTLSGEYTTSYTVEDKYITIPTAPVRGEQYKFEGWYTDSTLTQGFTNNLKNSPRDVHLYAKWDDLSGTVIFDGNGGSSPDAKNVIKGKTYGTLPTPTRTGYSFLGWYTAKSSGVKVESGSTVTQSGAQTLYAHWSVNKYGVTLNANGGNAISWSKGITYLGKYGECGALPTPTRTNYQFLGWYTAPTGGTKITDDTQMTTAASHALYAQWLCVVDGWDAKRINSEEEKTSNLPSNLPKITEGDEAVPDYTEIVTFSNVNVAQLMANGKTRVRLVISFGVREIDNGNQELYFYVGTTSTLLAARDSYVPMGIFCDGCVNRDSYVKDDPHVFAMVTEKDSEDTYWHTHLFVFDFATNELLNSNGEFCIGYGANGKSEDDWYLGMTYIEVQFY